MNRTLSHGLALLIWTLILGVPGRLASQQLDHVLGQILIEFEDGVQVHKMISDWQIFENQRTAAGVRQLRTAPVRVWSLRFDQNVVDEYRFLEEVRNRRGVKKAQFNHLISLRNIPDDPQFSKQWQYINDGSTGGLPGADIDMDLAWDIATGGLTVYGDTIVACVIDGGMDPNHDDFDGNLWVNYAEIPDNGIDDDENGYVDDYHGWSAYEGNDDVFKGGSHGTPVAGIIGARGNNGIGVAGVNWNIKLMIVRGGGNEAEALESYAYPYIMRKRYNETNGASGAFVVVTNASWGTDLLHWEDAPLWCSFYDSLGAVGILNCGATANRNYNIDEDGDMPTSCPSDFLISVTNMNSDDVKVSSAGYGLETIDLGTYGQGTWTAALGNSYGAFGGTSGATPHVSGAVALAYATQCEAMGDLYRTDPAQAARLVKDLILEGVVPNESLAGKTLTGGKLNVYNSLLLLDNFCGDCPFPVALNVDSIGLEEAFISWQVPVDSNLFDLILRAEGETEWDTLFAVESPLSLEDLTGCTSYEVRIRTRCAGETGQFSFKFHFKTDGCCVLPESHHIILSDTSLLIRLDDILATDTYTLEYKLFGAIGWQSVTLDTNVFELPGLDSCQVYFYRFKSVCSAASTEFSEIFRAGYDCPACTMTDYCAIASSNFFEHIDSVFLGDFGNVSGPDKNAYGDYTFARAITLKAGQSYDFSLVPGFSENTYDEYIRVYVDLDADGNFGEEEALLNAFSAGGAAIKETLTMPIMMAGGTSRMRIIMSYQEIEGPCEDLSYGEIEDYCVLLDNSITDCLAGSWEVDTLSTGLDEIVLQWEALDGSLDYEYRYRVAGDTQWVDEMSAFPMVTLTGLDTCTLYEFQLRGHCTDGTSEYSDSFEFRTDCTTGVRDPGMDRDRFAAFPNPFSGSVKIQFPDGFTEPVDIEVFGVRGELLVSCREVRPAEKGIFLFKDALPETAGDRLLMIRITTREGQQLLRVIQTRGE